MLFSRNNFFFFLAINSTNGPLGVKQLEFVNFYQALLYYFVKCLLKNQKSFNKLIIIMVTYTLFQQIKH